MDVEILIPLSFFLFLASVILVPILAKERTRRSAHDLISQALARGQQIEPALIAKMSEDMIQEGDRARKSLGSAVILLALAGGIVGAAYATGGSDFHHGFLGPAIVLASVGAAFLFLAIFDYATKRKRG